ncbi:DUF4870 domain-containing protein [Myroides sp. LJL119]
MENTKTQSLTQDQGKLVAIISYLTIIGLVVAYILNKKNPTQLGSFHIRQSIGFTIVGFLLTFVGFVPAIGMILSGIANLIILVAFIYCLIAAFKQQEKELPIVGGMFQKWFTFV